MHLYIPLLFVTLATSVFAQPSNEPIPLTPQSTNVEIMQHLYQHELNQTQTDALAVNFADMSRERAYAIQRGRLA